MDRGGRRLWAAALLAAPAAALASWFGLGVLSDVAFSSTSTFSAIVATALAIAVAPALTWRAAVRFGRKRAAAPIAMSAVMAVTLFGGVLFALVLETSRALHQSA